MDITKEYIICSALWYKRGRYFVHSPANITHGTVVLCLRHWAFEQLIAINPDFVQDEDCVQGFITSKNRFVTRVEAAEIAIVQNQFKSDEERNEVIHSYYLFSENIY